MDEHEVYDKIENSTDNTEFESMLRSKVYTPRFTTGYLLVNINDLYDAKVIPFLQRKKASLEFRTEKELFEFIEAVLKRLIHTTPIGPAKGYEEKVAPVNAANMRITNDIIQLFADHLSKVKNFDAVSHFLYSLEDPECKGFLQDDKFYVSKILFFLELRHAVKDPDQLERIVRLFLMRDHVAVREAQDAYWQNEPTPSLQNFSVCKGAEFAPAKIEHKI